MESIFKLYYDTLDSLRNDMLAQEYKLRRSMEQFESMTRKVVGNIKKYSVIEFYHEEAGLQKKIKQLFDSLEQFNAYLPNSVIIQKDLHKV